MPVGPYEQLPLFVDINDILAGKYVFGDQIRGETREDLLRWKANQTRYPQAGDWLDDPNIAPQIPRSALTPWGEKAVDAGVGSDYGSHVWNDKRPPTPDESRVFKHIGAPGAMYDDIAAAGIKQPIALFHDPLAPPNNPTYGSSIGDGHHRVAALADAVKSGQTRQQYVPVRHEWYDVDHNGKPLSVQDIDQSIAQRMRAPAPAPKATSIIDDLLAGNVAKKILPEIPGQMRLPFGRITAGRAGLVGLLALGGLAAAPRIGEWLDERM